MANRERQEALEELYKQGVSVYSFSKLETIHNCLYEAYLTYIKGLRDKQEPNVYSSLGTKIHDTLEAIMNGNATEEDLLPALQLELDSLDTLGIDFPKGRDGSDAIRQGWITDMISFCQTYKAPKGKFETEQFFLYQTPNGNYLQGYIDLIRVRSDGSIDIYDYKTSSMYKGADLKSHSRQLTLYAMAKEQEGYKVRSIAWIFLKYWDVTYMGKKTAKSKSETEIKKVVERKNLVKDLTPDIRAKLLTRGVDEIDADFIIEEALKHNEIPDAVKDEFKLTPCVVGYEFNEETQAEANEYFDNTVARWESLLGSDEDEYSHKPFTKLGRNGKISDDSFYDSALCGYRKICSHLIKYNEERFAEKKEEEDLFS